MRIRCVHLKQSKRKKKHRVVLYYQDKWIILSQALDLLEHSLNTKQEILVRSSAYDTMTFLQNYSQDSELKEAIERILSVLSKCDDDRIRSKIYFTPTKQNRFVFPLKIESLRDFSLWEQHMIDSKRGFIKRFMPFVYYIIIFLELIFPKPFFALKPPSVYYQKPIYYVGNHQNVFENNQTIPWPCFTKALDFELELAAVISRTVKPNETCKNSVGGFLLFNDFSARDLQKIEMFESGFGPVKTKSFANGFGYDIITSDEVFPCLYHLNAQVSIFSRHGLKKGECHGNTSSPVFSLEDMLNYANLGETLYPGDVLGLGTVPGCSGMESDIWVKPGDKVKLEIPELDLTLSNKIGHQSDQKDFEEYNRKKSRLFGNFVSWGSLLWIVLVLLFCISLASIFPQWKVSL
eukprot:gb/GECH01001411.1/.p1 GENE.gb/GECH01001411.1/~~gb/GECH01001411.1/.p1  ORF type:complete len:406 (+),score=70.04 gb/GECH01001411.1/:1-1218(+)